VVTKSGLIFCIYYVLLYMLLWMHACATFSFSVLSQEICWKERLQNDL